LPKTHRQHALLPRHAQHGIVAVGPAGSRVDEHVHCLVEHGLGRFLREHDLDVGSLEDLVVRVECQAAQLTLDEIRSVLHDGLQFDMPIRALPSWNEMEHVHARSSLAVLDALPAG